MLTLTIILPLLSSLIAGSLSQHIGFRYIANIPIFLIGVNFINILIIAYQVLFFQENYFVNFGNWIDDGLLVINWKFHIDNLNAIMLIVVGGISFLVHLYSLDYMAKDPNLSKFMAFLSLFTFFMIILITGDNFILLFLGWEGVGLCSYLLISFWFTRIQANKAAIKALVVNRIGDFALTLGIICIYTVFKSLDFATVFGLIPFYSNVKFIFLNNEYNVISTISLLLFIGAMGKSAQIGLHTWLPDAMEGPTPVSALIHAATMVTAGVFLIIKCSFFFEYAPKILVFITFIGAITSFFAASIGLVQNDIKKVVAYSTCSQLGYMIFACGLSNYNVSFFHLTNHAFFKALLFLSSGAIIHSMSNEQDTRRYGGLINLLPFTSTMLFIGSLALMGFPFLTGFYSKDLILEVAYSKYTINGSFCYWLGLLTAFLTSFYSYRVFYVTFISTNNSFKQITFNIHELPKLMAISLSVLALCSIFFGYLAKDLFVGLGTDFWNSSIFILPQNNNQFVSECIPQYIKLLPFFLSLIAVIAVNFIHFVNLNWLSQIKNINFIQFYKFLIHKWYFDLVYNNFINLKILKFANSSIFKLLDKGILEHIGPQIFLIVVNNLWKLVKQIQTGKVNRYGYFMIICMIIDIMIRNI